jgi:biopolymer transport protein ExbB/TolQ
MSYWGKRILFGLIWLVTLVIAAFIAFVIGRRHTADALMAPIDQKLLELERKRLEDSYERTAAQARQNAHDRAELEAKEKSAQEAAAEEAERGKRATRADVDAELRGRGLFK